MRILALETSSPRLSLAVGTEAGVLKDFQGPLEWRHAESLFEGLQKLLARVRWNVQSLEGIVVSTGPGSFTGIRIGLAAARALGQSLKVPVAGISSLETIAQGHRKAGHYLCPVIDALRGDVFTALYQVGPEGRLKTLRKECRLSLQELLAGLKPFRQDPLVFAGDAVAIYKEGFLKARNKRWTFAPTPSSYPQARVLLELGRNRLKKRGESYQKVVPLYLRGAAAQERRAP